MQNQKTTKKEKIEKIKDALDYNLKEYGYFQIQGKDNILIKGYMYTIFEHQGKTYIFVYENSDRTYIIMPLKYIRYIAPYFFKIE
ncbi:MAG: hypothetical protein RXO36_04590 [Candidatus Nanopusillus acidilobi]